MDIQKDALLRVVKATRASIRLAKTMQNLLVDTNSWTWADEISGQLCDALFELSGEKLESGQDFLKDSMTMKILKGDMDDESVTEWILLKDRIRQRLDGNFNYVPQPKPNIFSAEEMNELFRKNGGYSTPEGSWT